MPTEVRQFVANDLVTQFNNALRQRYRVSVNERTLDMMSRN